MKNIKPETLIKSIRESFIGSVQVYSNGSCFMFFRILKTVYPKAQPYWSKIAKHCISKIGNQYYDINGVVEKTTDYFLDNEETYISWPIAIAFPIKKEQRYRPTTPTTTDKI